MEPGTDLARQVGAVLWRVTEQGTERTRRFLGTAFSFSRRHRLFLTARHVLHPSDHPEGSGRLAIAVLGEDSLTTRYLTIENEEVLQGQPDLCIVQTSDGVTPIAELCATRVGLWQPVRSIGIPDSLARPQTVGFTIAARGFSGIIQRTIVPGTEPYASGAAFELSFPIPEGASGSPIFAHAVPGAARGAARGLIGVGIGNAESSSMAFSEDSEFRDGQFHPIRTKRVVEFGIAADLLAIQHSHISLADGETLAEVSGSEDYP